MRVYLSFFISIAIVMSCKNDVKISKHKLGPFLVEGHFIHDTLMDGEMKYYNNANKLITIINYQNGIKQGPSTNYYLNGVTYDSISFYHGLKDGFHYIYDSIGRLSYIDFYSKGHSFGPQLYLLNGKKDKYYFNEFEKEPLYACAYDSAGNIIREGGKINFVVPSIIEVNNKTGIGFFAYFINPPHLDIEYSLFMRDSILKKDSVIKIFDKSQVYLDTIFNYPINDRYSYYYQAKYFDSVNHKQKLIITKLAL